jgi:hypothetical protein
MLPAVDWTAGSLSANAPRVLPVGNMLAIFRNGGGTLEGEQGLQYMFIE